MKRVTLTEIAQTGGVSEDQIKGRSRKESIATAREIFWYCLNIQKVGLRGIAAIDGRARQTISSGIRTVKNLIETNHPLIHPYRELLKNVLQDTIY